MKVGTNTIILDAYNANPSSMRAAIENFATIGAEKKVLLLGAMAELGEESRDEHQSIIDLISQYKWDKVALVGSNFNEIGHPFLRFDNAKEAASWFQQQAFQHTHVLIKGSRSAKMELVLQKP